jgi:hypothetical protein
VTTKRQVKFDTYRKQPRRLSNEMLKALDPGGSLHPLLAAVRQDDRLRLEIRDRRFNIYYGGGSLLLVDGRSGPWIPRFDRKYFKGADAPTLPPTCVSLDDAIACVNVFPKLIAGMEDWWGQCPKGERLHCQALATTTNKKLDLSDYFVLDLEYQWAQRRLDLVAAKRNQTHDDVSGWRAPHFVFVEVKCERNACVGPSGLRAHALDYRDIIEARHGHSAEDIKREFECVIEQKRQLGLVDARFAFERFSEATPELLFVLIGLDPAPLQKAMAEVKAISDELGDAGRIRFLSIDSKDYRMLTRDTTSVDRLINLRSSGIG